MADLGLSEASAETIKRAVNVRPIAVLQGEYSLWSQDIAGENNCTPAQIALAWLLQQEESIVPIPGTRRFNRLNENASAIECHLSIE